MWTGRIHKPVVVAVSIGLFASWAWAGETALDRYVSKPDAHYDWSVYYEDHGFLLDEDHLVLTSQKWRDESEVDRAVWRHEMVVVTPWSAIWDRDRTALLFIDGGGNNDPFPQPVDVPDEVRLAALFSGWIFVWVKQIPNQKIKFAAETDPRYMANGRKEDELLAFALDRALATGDEAWPAHFAMTKAVVRAMDAAQEFLWQRKGWLRIEDFVVGGASKRGWTTWLTAAVDPRVRAVLPISIDILNIEAQMDRHWDAYGFYAPAVHDYADLDLFCRMKTPWGYEVMSSVDPHHYRDRLTMPKLVINSAGDQFFLPDSSQYYFSDLPGQSRLLYTVNTDHEQSTDIAFLLDALTWVDQQMKGETPPAYDWSFEPDGSIRVVCNDPGLQSVKQWTAANPNSRDFRLETIGPAFTAQELTAQPGGVYTASVQTPAEGWTAFVVELTFANGTYTTDVRIVPETLPYEGSHCGPD